MSEAWITKIRHGRDSAVGDSYTSSRPWISNGYIFLLIHSNNKMINEFSWYGKYTPCQTPFNSYRLRGNGPGNSNTARQLLIASKVNSQLIRCFTSISKNTCSLLDICLRPNILFLCLHIFSFITILDTTAFAGNKLNWTSRIAVCFPWHWWLYISWRDESFGLILFLNYKTLQQ